MNKWPHFSASCRKDINRILRSGRLTAYKANGKRLEPDEGSEAYEFEREVERKFHVKHAVAVNSGTAALHAGLVGLELRGREVLTSPFTFSATTASIILAGGTPRFCDVDPRTFCITKETVAPHVTKKTAAILPVSLFGYRPDYRELAGFDVPVIEDGCQAVGATRDGHVLQPALVAQTCSFNGSKNLPSGEGGALLTQDSKLAHKARLLVNHGENFDSPTVGFNYRMTELHACLARHGLRELEGRNQRRVELACEWLNHLTGLGWANTRLGPMGFVGQNVYYVLPFTLAGYSRSRFISRCAKRGLPIQESYTTPLHHLKAFRKYCDRKLPVVDELHEKTLCLLTTLTPDRPLSYARWCAKVIREALE